MTASTTRPTTSVGFLRTTRMIRAPRDRWSGSSAGFAGAMLGGGSEGGRRPPPSSVFNAWVDDDIDEVHHEVEQHVDAGDHEDDALDHRMITSDDRVHREAAEPRQREHALGDDGAADEQREAEADDGDDGQGGVLERVAHEHAAWRQPLGKRRG